MPTFENEDTVMALSVKAGIKRDGTQLDGDYWFDGQQLRFRNGRPKKIGGRREIVNGLEGPASSVYVHSQFPQHQVYNFNPTGIQSLLVDNNGVGAAPFDRSPVGFVTDPDYVWQVAAMFDATGGGNSVVIAHPGLNGSSYDQTTDTDVVFALATGATLFTSIGQAVSGGCVVLGQFLVIYGTDGLIKNSDASDPTDFVGGFADENNPVPDKIIKGLPLRGGSSSPAGLFWSLSALVKMSFIGGAAAPFWRFDVLSDKISIIAPNAPVEYDGVFYWPGTDRFLMYNGVVKELPNPLNQDFFYDNLNYEARARVWGAVVPRWGEIWWFFPTGSSMVCNHAVIFNVREGTWYDTPTARSAGYPPKVLRWPVWADANSNSDDGFTDKYRMWQHEYGVDEVRGQVQVAIPSYAETSAFGIVGDGTGQDGQPADNFWTRVERIEPDIKQVGPMTAQLRGGIHARSPDELGDLLPVAQDATVVDLRGQRRLPRLRFTSNVLGGDYHFGRTILRLSKGDARE